MNDFTRDDIQEIADRAADKAVSQLFRALGVDIQNQTDLNDLRADLIYSRRLRRLTENTSGKVWMVVATLTTIGIATFLWGALADKFGPG